MWMPMDIFGHIFVDVLDLIGFLYGNALGVPSCEIGYILPVFGHFCRSVEISADCCGGMHIVGQWFVGSKDQMFTGS
jgi:hypothetical protein